VIQNKNEFFLELAPGNDHVYYSVFEQELGTLKSFGKLLAEGLFDPEFGGPLDISADDVELLLAAQ